MTKPNDQARHGEDWQPCHPMRRKRLTSGEHSNPPELLMSARNDDGETIYRRPTAEEKSDYVSGAAW